MLYVDADNGPALGLYEQLGFTVHSTNAAFVADVGSTEPPPASKETP